MPDVLTTCIDEGAAVTTPSLVPRLVASPRAAAESTVTPSADVDLALLAEADFDELADRLHDGAVQAMVAARFMLDLAVAAHPEAAEHLAPVRESLQEGLREARRLIADTRPRGSAKGLADALDVLVDRWSTQDVPVLVAGTGDPRIAALNPAVAMLAYRFAQEAVRGAVERGATGIHITTSVTGSELSVSVKDDAAALRPATAGLVRWKSRLARLGGRLEVAAGHTLGVLPVGLAASVATTEEWNA